MTVFVSGLTVNFKSFAVAAESVPPVPVVPPEEAGTPVGPPVVSPVELVVVVAVPPPAGTLAMTRAVKLKSTVFGLLNLRPRVPVSSSGWRSEPVGWVLTPTF